MHLQVTLPLDKENLALGLVSDTVFASTRIWDSFGLTMQSMPSNGRLSILASTVLAHEFESTGEKEQLVSTFEKSLSSIL